VTGRHLTDNRRCRDNRWNSLNLSEISAAVAAATQSFAALQQSQSRLLVDWLDQEVVERNAGRGSAEIDTACGRRAIEGVPSGRAKLNAHPHIRTPDHVTWPVDLVVAHDQNEIVRNANLARNFEACAGRRHVPDATVNAGGSIKRDRAAFECA
jgi:hypothetical protein